MVRDFWVALEMHDWCHDTSETRKRALLLYQGRVRRDWHKTLGTPDAFRLLPLRMDRLHEYHQELLDNAYAAKIEVLPTVCRFHTQYVLFSAHCSFCLTHFKFVHHSVIFNFLSAHPGSVCGSLIPIRPRPGRGFFLMFGLVTPKSYSSSLHSARRHPAFSIPLHHGLLRSHGASSTPPCHQSTEWSIHHFTLIRVRFGRHNQLSPGSSTSWRMHVLPVSPNGPFPLLAKTNPMRRTTKDNAPFGTSHKQQARRRHPTATPLMPPPSSSPYVWYVSDATSTPCQSYSAQPLAHGMTSLTPTARELTKRSKPGKEELPYAASGSATAAVVSGTTICTHVPDVELLRMAPADALVLRKHQPRTPYKADAWQRVLQEVGLLARFPSIPTGL